MDSLCIVGLGAIGGLLGARLAHAGLPVRALARGATAAAVRRDGLSLIDGERTLRARIEIHDDARSIGVQSWLLISLKSGALPALAPALAPLIGPRTRIISMMNGVPWWFAHGLPARAPTLRLDSVDPQRVVSGHLPPAQVLGTVTHLSAFVEKPGRVHRVAGNRIIVGAPSIDDSPDPGPLIDMLRAGGFEIDPAESIHRELWFKLWGNMTMNPISALTGATSDRILDDPLVRAFTSAVMREAAAIGSGIGLPIDAEPEQRHQVTRKLGAFRTSMLQDLEAGKPLEIDALVGAVREIGIALGLATPNIDALLGLIRLRAQTLGLYP